MTVLSKVLGFTYPLTDRVKEIDKEALEAMVESDLDRDAHLAVQSYTDWLACRIVREGNYSVPTLEEINCQALQDEYDIHSDQVLKRVVAYMHSQPTLPLLGRIEEGNFKPEYAEFETWKSFYEWEK